MYQWEPFPSYTRLFGEARSLPKPQAQNKNAEQTSKTKQAYFCHFVCSSLPTKYAKNFVPFCKQMFTGVWCYLNGSKSKITVLCWVPPAKGLSWRQQNVKQVFKSIFVPWGSQQRELAGTRSGLFTQGLLFRLRKGSEITQAKNKTSVGKKIDHMQ